MPLLGFWFQCCLIICTAGGGGGTPPYVQPESLAVSGSFPLVPSSGCISCHLPCPPLPLAGLVPSLGPLVSLALAASGG